MPTSATWTTMVTAGVALYGAALSTYNAIVAHRKSRRYLTVTISIGLLGYAIQKSKVALIVVVANPSEKQITVNSVSLTMPDGKNAFLPYSPGCASLPHDLDSGKDFQIWTFPEELSAELKSSGYEGKIKIRARCNEATGRVYMSKRFTYNIDHWLKEGKT